MYARIGAYVHLYMCLYVMQFVANSHERYPSCGIMRELAFLWLDGGLCLEGWRIQACRVDIPLEFSQGDKALTFLCLI